MSLVNSSSVLRNVGSFATTVLGGVMGRRMLLDNENRCQWG